MAITTYTFCYRGNLTAILAIAFIFNVYTRAQDEALAVDRRDFSDPQRHREKAKGHLRGASNHIGYHHTVFAGLLRGGAQVFNQQTRQKENLSLIDWWGRFVLQPLWSKVQNFSQGLQEWERQGVSDRGVKPRLFVVFFCKWGRRRSVALQKIFIFICKYLKWLRLAEASHLSSHSWKWVTCDCCEVLT